MDVLGIVMQYTNTTSITYSAGQASTEEAEGSGSRTPRFGHTGRRTQLGKQKVDQSSTCVIMTWLANNLFEMLQRNDCFRR